MRKSTHPIQPFFLTRTSSRAFSEERLSEDELMSLFEAARWAPSSYNNQPWRFLFARQGDEAWPLFFDALVDFNKKWTANADTLIVAFSRDNFLHNNKPSRTAPFDTGAAWMSLAIEAHLKGFVAHGMEGFNYDLIKKNLQIPDGYTVHAMIAVGKPGPIEKLPEEIRKQEVPSDRRALNEMVLHGVFSFSG